MNPNGRVIGMRRISAFNWFVFAGGAVNVVVAAVLVSHWLMNG